MYDHNIKAGNLGDVIKHNALIAAASALMEQSDGIFHYADAYAGYAYNPLKSDGEWKYGIGVLHDSGFTTNNPAIRFWQELWECKAGLRGSVYPGSSLFMLKLCMEKGLLLKARLWDISPNVISQLLTFYDHSEFEIITRPAAAAEFESYKPDLLLIDPPDLADVDHALKLFKLVDNAILWLPVTTKGGKETEASILAYQKCKYRGLPVITVTWESNQNTRGCRLVYNSVADSAESLRTAVFEVVSLMDLRGNLE